ncbi:SDR family oxidoreductase [Chryseosolibacter indicus]|uniref:SDR family oxidoreductase n=1 Tax=Chryseosolibacter indicus TaxID=2782351 RepID=A0ABS5VVN3_9BACT|nr:SDR family oxidoreductase [Chryseosolibacter indicus]MBT1704056.1 SDR family oxidoreductase [Chryseosolibacter indicus]
MSNYSSIPSQFLELTSHHSQYAGIDTKTTLKGSAAGKVVFISGASQGIGQATAVAFAQAGAKAIYITARSVKGLEETKAKIAKENPDTQCAYQVCDVTDAEQVQAAVNDCVSKFGGIDIADANAGNTSSWSKRIGESDVNAWWQTWEVNMKGAYYVVRFTIPHLIQSAKKNNGGYLILLSSIGAQYLVPGASAYQTSKHAINRLCEFINVDHGAEGVKCFSIHPGGVPTSLAKTMPDDFHSTLVDEPELAAGFIVWLCSGKADWAKGRYLSSNWDVNELLQMKDQIIAEDLLVNRLRAKS